MGSFPPPATRANEIRTLFSRHPCLARDRRSTASSSLNSRRSRSRPPSFPMMMQSFSLIPLTRSTKVMYDETCRIFPPLLLLRRNVAEPRLTYSGFFLPRPYDEDSKKADFFPRYVFRDFPPLRSSGRITRKIDNVFFLLVFSREGTQYCAAVGFFFPLFLSLLRSRRQSGDCTIPFFGLRPKKKNAPFFASSSLF